MLVIILFCEYFFVIPQVIFLLCRLETERAAKNAPRMPGNRRDRSPEYPSDGHRPENPSPKRRLRHRPPFRAARFAARARGETRSAIRIEAPSGRPERPSSTLVALGHHKPDPFPSTSFATSPSTSPKPSLKLLGTTTVPPVSRTLSYKRCIARRRSATSFFA